MLLNKESITLDSADNVLLTGSLRSTGSFAGTPLPTSGEEDILVAKLSGAGTLAWAIMVGGAGADVGYGLAVDSSDHAWVVGRFHAPLTVAGIPLAGAGFDDVIVFEVSPAGTPLWGMAAGGSSFDYALEVASSAAGAPWVTGYFQGVADFGGTQLSASGGTDIFLWQVEP